MVHSIFANIVLFKSVFHNHRKGPLAKFSSGLIEINLICIGIATNGAALITFGKIKECFPRRNPARIDFPPIRIFDSDNLQMSWTIHKYNKLPRTPLKAAIERTA